jgi:hypothetical protein
MSIWTHVAGIIRFDAIQAEESNLSPEMGNTCDFESTDEEWDKCNVPRGSEGSIKYLVWTNPRTSLLAAYSVMIWGDLRSYNDVNEIKEYLVRVTKGKIVRQLVVEVSVEGREPVTFAGVTDQDGIFSIVERYTLPKG